MTEKSPKTAVLLINLGSPDEPTASALKPYLREFLSDRRVVDLNPIFWQTLLNLVILPRRSPKSAARYVQVWMKEGAPLKVYTTALPISCGSVFSKKPSTQTCLSACVTAILHRSKSLKPSTMSTVLTVS